jgi:hypothetical protein
MLQSIPTSRTPAPAVPSAPACVHLDESIEVKKFAEQRAKEHQQAQLLACEDRANEALARRNFEGAVAAYTQAILHSGSDKVLYYSNRSDAYAKMKKWAEALADAQRCMALDPSFAKGYDLAGVAFFNMGKYREAMNICSEGMKLIKQPGSCWVTHEKLEHRFLESLVNSQVFDASCHATAPIPSVGTIQHASSTEPLLGNNGPRHTKRRNDSCRQRYRHVSCLSSIKVVSLLVYTLILLGGCVWITLGAVKADPVLMFAASSTGLLAFLMCNIVRSCSPAARRLYGSDGTCALSAFDMWNAYAKFEDGGPLGALESFVLLVGGFIPVSICCLAMAQYCPLQALYEDDLPSCVPKSFDDPHCLLTHAYWRNWSTGWNSKRQDEWMWPPFVGDTNTVTRYDCAISSSFALFLLTWYIVSVVAIFVDIRTNMPLGHLARLSPVWAVVWAMAAGIYLLGFILEVLSEAAEDSAARRERRESRERCGITDELCKSTVGSCGGIWCCVLVAVVVLAFSKQFVDMF